MSSSRNCYGQDYFTLRSTFLQGCPPKSVNIYWRRFSADSIPLEDPQEFELWLRQRWLEKEELLEGYVRTGRFPAYEGNDSEGEPAVEWTEGSKTVQGPGYIETEVKLAHWFEIGQIFMVLIGLGLIASVLVTVWNYGISYIKISKGKEERVTSPS